MNDLNFVNDPVNPNYIIIVKLNAVDESFANVKNDIISKKINRQNYLKLCGEINYLWCHLKPLLIENKSKINKKVDYEIEENINILNGDRFPTYQELKKIIDFFHDICYHCNITKPRSYVKVDYTQTNAVRGLKNGTVFE